MSIRRKLAALALSAMVVAPVAAATTSSTAGAAIIPCAGKYSDPYHWGGRVSPGYVSASSSLQCASVAYPARVVVSVWEWNGTTWHMVATSTTSLTSSFVSAVANAHCTSNGVHSFHTVASWWATSRTGTTSHT